MPLCSAQRLTAAALIALALMLSSLGCEAAPRPESQEAGDNANGSRSPDELVLLPRPPEQPYEELGWVAARIDQPVRGLNHGIPPERMAFTPIDPNRRREIERAIEVDHREIEVITPGERILAPRVTPLQQALRRQAARLGADAVILRDAGVDAEGRLWSTGIAIRY